VQKTTEEILSLLSPEQKEMLMEWATTEIVCKGCGARLGTPMETSVHPMDILTKHYAASTSCIQKVYGSK
jgi:hypothetical protein